MDTGLRINRTIQSSEIYVRRFPSLDSRAQISNDGGTRPVWSHDGRELFYAKADGTMVVVPVERADAERFIAGAGRTLFKGDYYLVQSGRTYDVSRDGRRFLMIKDTGARSGVPPSLAVVLNWSEELKRLVPNN